MGWRQNMVKRAALAIILAAASLPATAQDVQPWTETVVSVTDIGAAKRLFVEVGGWRTTHKGRVDRSELEYWRLPASTSAKFDRICAPKTFTGCIRFVQFSGVAQRPIRQAARAWDTGGIYSIMVRSDNVQDLFDRAITMGWWAESEPVRFTFGTSDLSNVVLTGPHGINLAVYQRHSPAFTAFTVGRISQAFNSMRMVKSRAAARDFYRDKLGFSVLFDSGFEPAEPARSNFGIPLNYTPQIKRAAAALQPQAGETGRVEVMQIDGFAGGSDFAAFASPPNLGIISVRYPVDDAEALAAKLKDKGVDTAYFAYGVAVGALTHSGRANIFAVRDPDGNLTEFYDDCCTILANVPRRTRP
jgi:catechol 2,3-dioxygenase-like lactoylglutathione lyase family enzyme